MRGNKVKDEVLPQTLTSYPFHLPFHWKCRSVVAPKHPLSCWWDRSSQLGTRRAPPQVCDPTTGCRCCHRFLPAAGKINGKKIPVGETSTNTHTRWAALFQHNVTQGFRRWKGTVAVFCGEGAFHRKGLGSLWEHTTHRNVSDERINGP